MSALGELATAARKVRRLRDQVPEPHRPPARETFEGLEAATREVRALIAKGRDAEAEAVVADWEQQAVARVITRLAHAPLEEAA